MPQYKFSTKFPYIKKRSNKIVPIQKIVIPAGLISSSRTAVIEVPEALQTKPTIVAKYKGFSSYDEFYPLRCSSVRHSHLFPKAPNASVSLNESQYSRSFSGDPYTTRDSPEVLENRSYNIPPRRRDFERVIAKSFPNARGLRMPLLHESGITYGGMGWDYSPDYDRTFYKQYMPDETSIVGSHYDAEDEYEVDESTYGAFEPLTGSTPKRYAQPAEESFLNALDYSEPQFNGKNPIESGLIQMLDTLDEEESYQLQEDLRDVQDARRKLLYDVSLLRR